MNTATPTVESLDIDLSELNFGPGADDVIIPKGPAVNALSPNTSTDVLDIVKAAQEEEDQDNTPVVKAKPTASIPDEVKPLSKKDTTTTGLDDVINEFKPPVGDEASDEDEPVDAPSQKGRAKVEKDALVEYLKEKIESKEFSVFEDYDEKTPLDEYLSKLPAKELRQLLDSNWQAKEQALINQTPAEFFESLPSELQYAAEYVAQGGKDLKGLFRALGEVEEVRQLDPSNENDQLVIAKSYLEATKFGTPEEISEQIEEWKDTGTIEKKVKQFKPKLDQMQEQQVQYKLKQQEEYNRQQQALAEYYTSNVFEALKPGELNGVKLDKKVQNMLYSGLTEVRPSSVSGKPVNLLGELLEKIQYSAQPDYKLLAEATYLLADPEGYRNAIRQQGKNEQVEKVVKQLKTEQYNKPGAPGLSEPDKKLVNKMPKPRNVFERA